LLVGDEPLAVLGREPESLVRQCGGDTDERSKWPFEEVQ
jgi:hypothetical protein